MREWKRVIAEALVVFAVLTVIAFLANAQHDDGLDVTRDYFAAQRKPVAKKPVEDADPREEPEDPENATEPKKPEENSPVDPAEAEIRARLEANGLKAAEHDQVVEWFQDPAYQAGAYLFVDARNERTFAEGHIPGALQLDHFYLDRGIEQVVQAAQSAAVIVVYCNGGDCTDSESVALDLVDQGISPDQIHVYLGGIKAWRAADLPIEEGTR
ncbi:MAG: rhodanese-like domain-containing protein [Planctomycetota bacterium]